MSADQFQNLNDQIIDMSKRIEAIRLEYENITSECEKEKAKLQDIKKQIADQEAILKIVMIIPKLQKLSEKYGIIAYQMLMLLELARCLLYSIGPNESNHARYLLLISSKQNSWAE